MLLPADDCSDDGVQCVAVFGTGRLGLDLIGTNPLHETTKLVVSASAVKENRPRKYHLGNFPCLLAA
jgi:hypothetical protein